MKYPKEIAIDIVTNIKYLNIAEFIDDNKDSITKHLKGFMEKTKSKTETEQEQEQKNQEQKNKDKNIPESVVPESVEFFSEVLPFMSGIVNVGAQPEDYEKAKVEVENRCKNENKGLSGSVIYILSIYTFIYIVEKGLEEDKGNKDMWEFFKAQALWLCNVPNDAATDATATKSAATDATATKS
jgi:hypothetical protein